MYPSAIFAALILSVGFVSAQCPPNSTLTPVHGKCLCVNGADITPPVSKCVFNVSPNGTACYPMCPSHVPSHFPSHTPTPRSVKRQQLMMNEDGTIVNCPPRTISCPIDPTMNMGYECISPFEDLDNCGGCVALGQGIACESLPGVRKTECNRGRCVNHSCRSGWVLDTRSNNCVPRLGRHGY